MSKFKNIDKTFCDLSKREIDKYEEELKILIKEPKFFCKKCLRVSADKIYLCKPDKISQ